MKNKHGPIANSTKWNQITMKDSCNFLIKKKKRKTIPTFCTVKYPEYILFKFNFAFFGPSSMKMVGILYPLVTTTILVEVLWKRWWKILPFFFHLIIFAVMIHNKKKKKNKKTIFFPHIPRWGHSLSIEWWWLNEMDTFHKTIIWVYVN